MNSANIDKIGRISSFFFSPLSSMSASLLLISASSRVSYALVTAGALIWVYMLSIPIQNLLRTIYNKPKDKIVLVFISSFAGSLYILILYIVNPFLAMETMLWTLLAPVLFVSSEAAILTENDMLDNAMSKALYEAVSLGALILSISFIREPLGFATLSLPGGQRGIIELFNSEGHYPFPVEIMSSTAGAFFLLAYIIVIFRYLEGGRK